MGNGRGQTGGGGGSRRGRALQTQTPACIPSMRYKPIRRLACSRKGDGVPSVALRFSISRSTQAIEPVPGVWLLRCALLNDRTHGLRDASEAGASRHAWARCRWRSSARRRRQVVNVGADRKHVTSGKRLARLLESPRSPLKSRKAPHGSIGTVSPTHRSAAAAIHRRNRPLA